MAFSAQAQTPPKKDPDAKLKACAYSAIKAEAPEGAKMVVIAKPDFHVGYDIRSTHSFSGAGIIIVGGEGGPDTLETISFNTSDTGNNVLIGFNTDKRSVLTKGEIQIDGRNPSVAQVEATRKQAQKLLDDVRACMDDGPKM